MKVRLPKVLCAALLASLICANSYAESSGDDFSYTANGVEYSYTANKKDDGVFDGTYNAKVTIGEGDSPGNVGSVYKDYAGDIDALVGTRIKDISFEMTGGSVYDLTASMHYGLPIDGKVQFDITGGTINNLYGGNRMVTGLQYGDATTIDSITINVKDAFIGYVTGGNAVSGTVTSDFVQNYTTSGNVDINIEDSIVYSVYGVNNSYDHVNGYVDIDIKNSNQLYYVLGSVGGSVSGNVSVTIDGCTGPSDAPAVIMVDAAYGGKVSGNASVTINNSDVTTVYAASGNSTSAESNASISLNGGTFETVKAVYGNTVAKNASVVINNGTEKDTVVTGSVMCVDGGSVGGNADVTVTGGAVQNIYVVKAGEVAKDANLTIEGNANETYVAVGVDGGTVKGNTTVTLKDGKVTYLEAISNGIVHGDAVVKVEGGEVTGGVYGSCINGKVGGNVNVNISGGVVSTLYAVTNGSVGTADNDKSGDVKVTFDGGKVTGDIIGVSGGTVSKDVTLELKGGSVGEDVSAVAGGTVAKDVTVVLNGSEVAGTVAGAYSGHVDGNVTIAMNGGTAKHIHAANIGTVTGDTTVYLMGGTVTGDLYGGDKNLIGGTRTLYVGTAEKAYQGTVTSYYGFDNVVIAAGSVLNTTDTSDNILAVTTQQYNITSANLHTALVHTLGSLSLSADTPITLQLNGVSALRSGRYMLIDASKGTVDLTHWTADNVNVTTGSATWTLQRRGQGGSLVSFEDMQWVDSILYLNWIQDDMKNALESNWGAFKSSQAFVSALWSGHSNAVVIDEEENDGKAGLDAPKGRTIAWGSVYGQQARIGGQGADYSIQGGAIGAERRFASGRSVGAAVGYDWGKVSPFGRAEIDQETAHVAIYGRAAAWSVRQKGTVAIDWSAAAGKTTSETDAIDSEWDQKNMQLDARVSYLHQVTDKATASVFAGAQYYAAEETTAGHTGVSSMQNLRTEVGAGMSYKLTPKTTVRGEVSVYNDAMRHNPYVYIDEMTYEGTNPGRMGGSISAGVDYQLNHRWSLYGNYSFDMADDSQEHNMNVGASYRF